ncbi:MAG TPA: ribonuclease III [Caulobacteraceae bacterium]|nr:ribonuclease III [Caulobacteraceae bacterium]
MDRRAAAAADLERRLGHAFADRELLDRALTHASAGQGSRKIDDNERLEFLGDRVLALVMAEELLRRLPDADVGRLSKRIHHLVSGPSCARVARALDIGPALRLPGGETRRGARDHDTILADACEALIGALFVELGLEGAAPIVLDLWRPLLDEAEDESVLNPKSTLQEWAAARRLPPPAYGVVSREGPDHQPLFKVEVAVQGYAPQAAEGGSRQAAEVAAALSFLKRESLA